MGVWFRHMRVYTNNIISNGLPPFLEPLIFLVGIGIGLGSFIHEMEGVPYIEYLASGLLVATAMFTAAFECSFGTFIRLEFDKVYDGMLASPMTPSDMLLGEILWAGTKGFFFSLAVLIIVAIFQILPLGRAFPIPIIGFLTGTMFASLSLLITSFVSNLNHFNFYFSGFLSPMFFFAGVVFPIETLPKWTRPLTEALPLTHPVRLSRAFSFADLSLINLFDILYIILFTGIVGFIAIRRLTRKLVD